MRVEETRAFLSVERTREGALGAMLPGDVKLLGGEQFFPLLIALHGGRGGVGSHVVQPRSDELLTALFGASWTINK